MTNEEESLILQIRSIIKELKTCPLEGNYRQTLENYIFDKDNDVRITISLLKKQDQKTLGFKMLYGY